MTPWQSWIAWALIRATAFGLASWLVVHDLVTCGALWCAFTAIDLERTQDAAMRREELLEDLRRRR